MGLYNESLSDDYVEPYDHGDDPRHETEFHQELERYWEDLDDKQRWSE